MFRQIRDNLGYILIFGSVASMLMYFGFRAMPYMSQKGIPYPSDWVIGNLVFFIIFGATVFLVFNGFIRQKDSQMRQNWTQTRWYLDQNSCPRCGSSSIRFDWQDVRSNMMFAKCLDCGNEWLFVMPQRG